MGDAGALDSGPGTPRRQGLKTEAAGSGSTGACRLRVPSGRYCAPDSVTSDSCVPLEKKAVSTSSGPAAGRALR